jgi:hypothetical protein
MTTTELDTLAKAPILVFLHVAGAKQGITPTDEKRFAELSEEAAKPNARKCLYTDAMRHMLDHFSSFYAEVNGNEGSTLVQAIRQILQNLPEDESIRFRSHLARVAMASARDESGHPVPAAVGMTNFMGQTFAMPSYGHYSKRLTDGLQIIDYWPGCDPLLNDFHPHELRSLAAVYGGLFATLQGCHGLESAHRFDDTARQWLMAAYDPEKTTCRVHALLRYLDQLFYLVQIEVQFAQSSLPLFQKGHALIKAKLTSEEQAVFMQLFNALGTSFVTPDAPPSVSEMLTSITAVMHGHSLPDGTLTEAEWDVLSLGLVASFLMVAAADGQVGDKELEVFANVIEALSAMTHLGLAVQAAARISHQMPNLWPVINSRTAPLPQYVLDAVQLAAARLDPIELEAYREIAMTIAQKTAEAEGGRLMGLGSKISAEERKVLNGLQALLGVSAS